MILRIELTCLLALLLISGFAYAGTIYIDNDAAPGGDGSLEHPYQYIQDGIDSATNGDTVIILDGTYTGPRNKNLDFNGKAIIVTSQNGPANTIIDCENDGRGFYFHSGEGKDSVLSGLTITRGRDEGGGGGIYCYKSSPIIINNNISGNINDAHVSGGGIYCSDSSHIFISGNTIADNRVSEDGVGYGGGIYLRNSSHAAISGNTIQRNYGGHAGGGIYCEDSTSTFIIDNIISDNTSCDGGGICCSGSTVISGNTIAGNSSGGYTNELRGGGINCSGSTAISGNTISGNAADTGGGICCSGNARIIGNTITDNICTGGSIAPGGGIYCTGSTYISGNIITGNWATGPWGGGICSQGDDNITDLGGGAIGSIGLNSIYDNGEEMDVSNFRGDATIMAENNWWGQAPPDPLKFYGNVDYTPWLSSAPSMVNIPPVAGNLFITPIRPLTNDDLTASYTYFDADGDPESGTEIKWYKDSILQEEYNNILTVPASATEAGQQWRFTVKPKDGKDFGDLQTSASVTINRPPAVNNPYISPAPPLTDDDLTANYGYSDPEDDPEEGTEIRWHKDAVLQAAYNDQKIVPKTATAKNEQWHFTVRPKDGKEFGELEAASPVMVMNTPPIANNLSITPAAPLDDDHLTADYTYFDADGDPENGTQIRWYKNGLQQSNYNDASIIPSSATSSGETWYFTIKPGDGTDFGNIQTLPPVLIGRISLSIPEVPGSPNTSVDIPVEISNTTGLGIIAVEFTLTYDLNILTVTKVTTAGTIAQSWGDPTYNITSGRIVLGMAGVTPLNGNGILLYITVKVAADAAIGATSAMDLATGRLNEGAIPAALRDGLFIVVETGIYGDVSGNGDVTSYDGALVLQNSVGLIQFTPQQKVLGDVSGSGDVTAYDAALILQYAVGIIDHFPVEEGGPEIFAIMANPPPIDVTVPDVTGAPGSNIIVPITVSDTTGAGVIGVDIILTYDPNILTPVDVLKDSTIAESWNIGHRVSEDKVIIGMMNFSPLSGSGTLVKIRFRVFDTARDGENSPLTLSRISFNEGNVTVNPKNGVFTVTYTQMELHLHPGWNLISVHFNIENNDISLVLKPIEGFCKSVWSYDANPGWNKYIYGAPDNQNSLNSIVPGKGYWLEMNSEATLIISGLPVTDAIPLHEGWNLVGYNSSTSRDIEAALSNVSEKCICVWTYDSLAGTWSVYNTDNPGLFNNIDQMEPGIGYWIYVTEDCEWDVSH